MLFGLGDLWSFMMTLSISIDAFFQRSKEHKEKKMKKQASLFFYDSRSQEKSSLIEINILIISIFSYMHR